MARPHVCPINDFVYRKSFKAFLFDQGQQGRAEEFLRPLHTPVIFSRSHNLPHFSEHQVRVRSVTNNQSLLVQTEPSQLFRTEHLSSIKANANRKDQEELP